MAVNRKKHAVMNAIAHLEDHKLQRVLAAIVDLATEVDAGARVEIEELQERISGLEGS